MPDSAKKGFRENQLPLGILFSITAGTREIHAGPNDCAPCTSKKSSEYKPARGRCSPLSKRRKVAMPSPDSYDSWTWLDPEAI
ncbi:hypothetical protein ACFX1R_026958 [Malus domestica]